MSTNHLPVVIADPQLGMPPPERSDLLDAARQLVHHYHCTLPTEGRGKCQVCSRITDPQDIGTLGVLVHRLEQAIERAVA